MRLTMLSGGLRRVHVPAFAVVLVLNLAACDWMQMKDPRQVGERRLTAVRTRQVQQACASARTYDRLKDLAFNEAIKIRNADPINLDKLATYSVIRMQDPHVTSRDDSLDITVCRGRFILHLPPGAEHGFNGASQIEADVEYTAQAAADGSGLIYQMSGADPIIYRLAAFDLQGNVYMPPEVPEQKLAAAPVPKPEQKLVAADPASTPVASAASPLPAAPVAPIARAPVAVPAARVIPASLPVKTMAPPPPKPVPVVAPMPKPAIKAPVQTAHAPPKLQPRAVALAAATPPKPKASRTEKALDRPVRVAARPAAKPNQAIPSKPDRPAATPARTALALARQDRPAQSVERASQAAKSRPKSGTAATMASANPPRPAAKPTRAEKAKSPPVQTARTAPAKPTGSGMRRQVDRTSLASAKPSTAPARAKASGPPSRPPLSVRIPELAALRKPAPATKAPARAPARPVQTAAVTSKPRVLPDSERSNKAVAVRPVASPPRTASAPPTPVRTAPPSQLASLERSMTRMYNSALIEADGDARYELRRTRERFVAYLDGCRTESCRARAYQGRIAEIRDILAYR